MTPAIGCSDLGSSRPDGTPVLCGVNPAAGPPEITLARTRRVG
ncbi:MAG TPA: hypothetical protein VKV35_08855 [Streptosporangiaceae bacterium]|nr:hypothetical protein [Streptosporangiaceae bacterium]